MPHGVQLDQVDDLLRQLRMPHARAKAGQVLRAAAAQGWDHAELLAELCQAELEGRATSMAATRRRRAKLPTGKTFEAWDPAQSSIPPATQRALRELAWITRRENLALSGPSGTGKSYFLEALASAALDAGHTVVWHSLESLGHLVQAHTIDNTVNKTITTLVRNDLIVIDDIGLLPVTDVAAQAFYRVVDAAYERTSIAVTSNIHPAGFDQFMPPTLATATIDRLLHHAHVIQTTGDSVRLTQAKQGHGVTGLT